jgi:membrane protein implicated in regulation of membrane protease activity
MSRWESAICLLLCLAIGATACLVVPGCALFARPSSPPAPAPPAPVAPGPESPLPPPPADDASLKDRLAYWERRAIVLEGTAAKASAEAKDARKQAETARREISLAPLRSAITWATWAGGVAAIAGGVLALLLGLATAQFPILARIPFGWKTATWISLCGLAAVALAQGLSAVLPWAGLAGLVLLGVGVFAGLVWVAATWKIGGQAAASEWVRYASELDDERRKALDEMSRKLQGRSAAVVDKLLPPPTGNPGTR